MLNTKRTITVFTDTDKSNPVKHNTSDYRTLLNSNQFITKNRYDAIRSVKVLGSAHASFEAIYWLRSGNENVFTDYVVTVK